MKKYNHTSMKVLAVLAAGFAVLKFSGYVLKGRGAAMEISAYLISTAALVLLAVLLGQGKRILPLRDGWKCLFTKGWYVLLASGILLFTVLSGLAREKEISFSPAAFLGFTAVCFLTACFEEIWFRGIIQGILEENRQRGKGSFWKTACITSALFGAMHLTNLLHRPEYILGTVTQAFYAFSLGMILSMVMRASGNIGTVILLHAIFNFSGSLSDAFVRQVRQQGDLPAASAVFILVLLMPGILCAGRMCRNCESPFLMKDRREALAVSKEKKDRIDQNRFS